MACRSFPSFPPRFASKCDRQSSDLTQDFSNPYNELTQGYYISCSIFTYDSAAQKYIFFHHPGDRTHALDMQVKRSTNRATPSNM